MSKNVSLFDTSKFEKVTGSNNSAEANIAGITPAEFIFNVAGRTNYTTRNW